MISASLLGALAGSGALPFPRESYEHAIGASGRGVKASLAAFAGAYDRARGGSARGPQPRRAGRRQRQGRAAQPGEFGRGGRPRRCRRCRLRRPGPRARQPAAGLAGADRACRCSAGAGPRHGAAAACGRSSTTRTSPMAANISTGSTGRLRSTAPDHDFALSIAAAKHLANAMCYDDMIRVADLKTRSTRDARVRREVGVSDGSILQVTEYFHPRIEEFCGTLPARSWPLHRGAAEARRLSRPPHQPRPPHPHRQLCRLCRALGDRRPAPLAPRAAAPQGRGGAS